MIPDRSAFFPETDPIPGKKLWKGVIDSEDHKAFEQLLKFKNEKDIDYFGQIDRYLAPSEPKFRESLSRNLMANVALVEKDVKQLKSSVEKEKLEKLKKFLMLVAYFLEKYPKVQINDFINQADEERKAEEELDEFRNGSDRLL